MIETYILQNLVAFDEYKTLVATSEKMNVTQPALTKSFKKLEEELGVPLFERTKNTIALNQTGQLAVKYARRLLALHGEMEHSLTDFYRRTREVYIGSIAPAPLWRMTDLFAESYPETKITTKLLDNNDELFDALRRDRFQIVVTTEFRADELFYSKEFFEEHLKISVPKKHPLAKKKEVTLADLAGETFIMLSDLGFWAKIKQNMIPDAKFITQKEVSDLRDIVNNSTLLTFTTDISENTEFFKSFQMGNRVSVPISDDEVNVKFYAVCRVERMRQLNDVLGSPP